MPQAPTSLPIEEALPALCDALKTHHEVVLIAPPGAGKTTRVPLAILQAPWLAQQKILLIESHRIATFTFLPLFPPRICCLKACDKPVVIPCSASSGGSIGQAL